MTGAGTIAGFDVHIPRHEALRLLGLHGKKRSPRRSVLDRFEELLHEARDLVEGRAILQLDGRGLPGSGWIGATLRFAAVVCTIGPELESRAADLARTGDTAGAMILDAIGSAAVEQLADQSNRRVCELVPPEAGPPARRRSPGYPPWDLREQTLLFRLLRPEAIGVTLTPTCMMVPRKSISYVVPLGPGWPDDPPGRRCSCCGRETCLYRED